jgi:hypothetical protein
LDVFPVASLAFIKNVYVVDGLRPVTVVLFEAEDVLSVPST